MGEVLDEAVEAGVTEVQGVEVGEARVEGEWDEGRGGEGEGGADEFGDGEEALVHQGDGLEVAVVAEADEDGFPALVRQVFPKTLLMIHISRGQAL